MIQTYDPFPMLDSLIMKIAGKKDLENSMDSLASKKLRKLSLNLKNFNRQKEKRKAKTQSS